MAGIYIHIPFCKRRCIYCDFYSTTQSPLIGTYICAVGRELEMRRHELADGTVGTIYLGGGTPSQLSAVHLNQIFDTIYKYYEVDSGAEITLEANPDDLTEEYISQLKALPVNRMSLGIQTFDEERLRFLRRRHTASEAIKAIRRLQEAGFDNISIDLIYGLPGETPALWQADIEQALALQVQHISAYNLIYEEGTPLWDLREKGLAAELDEDVSIELYRMLMDKLADGGFEHYEISNFCRPGYHSRHNSSYWTGTPYLGIGAAAHSYNLTTRRKNVADLGRYIRGIQTGSPCFEEETLDEPTRYNDLILTSLRTVWGLDLHLLEMRFGKRYADYCLHYAQPYIKQGKMEISTPSERQPKGVLRITRNGIFVSDEIMSDLMWV
jgi:putative oxygen-independent coproporphyrinogen III oxidase